ncbi:hypothetical protein GOP47_0010629 [Adiantum capillus-veneris]|uniref:Uncharacterized protein n=1 Tax=Adiantum capillus-veneris TaxID=13818 RepID=A0A9D4UV99_ADICA|nr:hypothetical protein GOP47_0010629 [Adiantum capillus-veneris]
MDSISSTSLFGARVGRLVAGVSFMVAAGAGDGPAPFAAFLRCSFPEDRRAPFWQVFRVEGLLVKAL